MPAAFPDRTRSAAGCGVSAAMGPLARWLIPLAAVALVRTGLGLHRWLGGPAGTPVGAASDPIAGNGQPTLVEFGMNTCASCKAMHQVLDELRAAHAGACGSSRST